MLVDMMETVGQQARRMGQMLDRMNVDVAELARGRYGLDFARARSICSACIHADVCEQAHLDWLAARSGGPVPEDYCANAPLFSRYAEQARLQEQDQAGGTR